MYLNLRTMEKSAGLPPADSTRNNDIQTTTDVPKGSYQMSQDNGFLVPENVILQTTNYSIFKFDPLNRAIRPDKVDRLYDAIQTKNLLHLFPIVVTREFVVVDGQHRLKVAEALDTPIYYIVSSQMRIQDAASVSANTDGWSSEDYLDHWCKIGLPDYLALRRFLDDKKWLNLSTAKQLCFKGDKQSRAQTGAIHGEFVGGTYKANNLEQAERVCTMALNFKTWVSFWKEAPFMSALRNLDSNTNYDHAHMMQKMQYQSVKLVKCATAADYIAVMNTIYNYGVPEAKRVHLTKISYRHPCWRD